MAILWLWNGQQSTSKPEYPVEIKNINGETRLVTNSEEHLEHALQTPKRRGIDTFAQLHVAKYPISEFISFNSKILHSIYVDTKRYGITYVYPTLEDTPALVKWGLDLIGNEYQKLENKKYQQTNTGTQGAPNTKTR